MLPGAFFVSHFVSRFFEKRCTKIKNVKEMKESETPENLEIPGETRKAAISRGLGVRADGGNGSTLCGWGR